ncbi:MAG: antibiotic biosynthesis monooxygenase [Chloroflexi bacterium]|jgi:quinol monooxygenase YgiN|uniref:ABM domain-containing protein n=1 Tax=marine metagenome TaxID=408172 RepID=A0A381RAI1_9ZZZZ|nr:antibiotic biosynthesis monooxygenase [Chloroflexota bacterium]MBI02798.1 antibiotic biosynthesis monooxygenase [Acidimicrobiaceae bacterium]MCH2419882.1 antibiotic biosynthesis monooxygenase [Acidimicrobiales bacterium]MEC9425609.1 antibiotic biosynthesis monooxygenase [Actinomycetota bacterium]HAW90652.1 antibiotic biosynthesis monooxygenase [Gemmatimonadota bacterium]|tara:strand:+ start:1370 stop:1729 length:360 start_codon:yes stop_codon:yes gene_type:complete
MIIIAGTLEFQNSDARDEATAQSSVLQLATREGEEGCRAYSFAPDPCVATRIQVYELWTDEDCLSAHFKHPNYLAMRDLLRSSGLVGSETLKYRIDLAEPVYDDNHLPRADFFTAGQSD